ncbi:MAG: HEAT repeat domain-containing protein [Planctomycetota bacterium]|nr:HEAT repeat domain-containing protein [Planctomycetota bacterium]
MRWKRFFVAVMLFAFITAVAYAGDLNKAKSQLAKAVTEKNKEKIEEALVEIVAEGGAKAVGAILDVLMQVPQKEADIYWQLVSSLSAFTDEDAMAEIGNLIVKYASSPLGKDILFVLQRNRTTATVSALRKVVSAEVATPEMRRLAVEILGNIRCVDSVDVLIEALERTRDSVKQDIIEVLTLLTGARLGDNPRGWKEWWSKQRPYGMPKVDSERKSEEGKGLGKGMTGTAVDELDDVRRERYFGLEQLKFPVLVIAAKCTEGRHKDQHHDLCFDHIEHVLDRMKIPNKVVLRIPLSGNLETDIPDIPKGTIAICINCTQMHQFCVCPFCTPGAGKHDRLFP